MWLRNSERESGIIKSRPWKRLRLLFRWEWEVIERFQWKNNVLVFVAVVYYFSSADIVWMKREKNGSRETNLKAIVLVQESEMEQILRVVVKMGRSRRVLAKFWRLEMV